MKDREPKLNFWVCTRTRESVEKLVEGKLNTDSLHFLGYVIIFQIFASLSIVNHFINFILKRTGGGATVDFMITLLTGYCD